MELNAFWTELHARINRYDLLCHPFYQAWSAGTLTTADLGAYACDYYHHVAAFPTYLTELHARLNDGPLRRAVLANACDEEGLDSLRSRAHSEVWLDFAEGMGVNRESARHSEPVQEVGCLIAHFHSVARQGTPEEALAAFYAYESQIPRVAEAKARGLRQRYAASDSTCRYFDLHVRADVQHSQVWREQLQLLVADGEAAADCALASAEAAAQALWKALDGIERSRQERRVA